MALASECGNIAKHAGMLITLILLPNKLPKQATSFLVSIQNAMYGYKHFYENSSKLPMAYAWYLV